MDATRAVCAVEREVRRCGAVRCSGKRGAREGLGLGLGLAGWLRAKGKAPRSKKQAKATQRPS